MSRDDYWQDLKDQFERALQESNQTRDAKWGAIWTLFIQHPWYTSELRRTALRVIQESGAPMDWLEDIENDAILLLGQSLDRALDLNMNTRRAKDHFPAWLARIIRNDCLQALRRYRRSYIRNVELREEHLAIVRRSSVEVKIDMIFALELLSSAEREVFVLRLLGWSIEEIATGSGVGYARMYRIVQRVENAVRRALGR